MVGPAPHSREFCLSGSRLCLSLNAAWIGWDVLGHWRVGFCGTIGQAEIHRCLWHMSLLSWVSRVLHGCPYWLWPWDEDHRFIPDDSILSDSDPCSRLLISLDSVSSISRLNVPPSDSFRLPVFTLFYSLGCPVVYGHSFSSHHYSENDILHNPWYLYAYPDFFPI